MRVFFDGSYYPKKGRAGLGAVVLEGTLPVARISAGSLAPNSLIAEYEAALLALRLIKERYPHRDFILYGDCKVLVAQVNGKSNPKADVQAGLCVDLRAALQGHRLRWVPREANMLADIAARLGCDMERDESELAVSLAHENMHTGRSKKDRIKRELMHTSPQWYKLETSI